MAEFICPACGGAIIVARAKVEQIVSCPSCHTDATVAATEPDPNANPFEGLPQSDVELDYGRIQQRATLRRALYRSRSYAIIAAVVCAVAIVQLGSSSYHAIQNHAIIWATVYIGLMVAGAIGSIYFYRRAIAFHHEAKQSDASFGAQSPPDFSTLDSGSQPWEKLNDVR